MIQYFKSILEQDLTPVVICDLQHTIVYMNQVAIAHYGSFGGEALIGKSVLDCHSPAGQDRIRQVLDWFAASPEHNRVHTIYSQKDNLDVYMVALRDEAGVLIGYYEKQEYRDRDMSPLYQM